MKKLTPEDARWRCNPEIFNFKNTNEIEPGKGIASQTRAIEALNLGLNVKSMGYNIYIAGLSGNDHLSIVKDLVSDSWKKNEAKKPKDICYVNNFKTPDNPICLILQAGEGIIFSKDMDELIKTLKENITMFFDRDDYLKSRREISEKYQNQQKKMYSDFEEKVKNEGFAMVKVQVGPFIRPDIMPMIAGNIMDLNQLETLAAEQKFSATEFERLKKSHLELSDELDTIYKETNKIEKQLQEEFKELDKKMIQPLIKSHVDLLRDKYKNEKLQEYLNEVENYICENSERFKEKIESQNQNLNILPFVMPMKSQKDSFSEFKVNVLVDNSSAENIPIIVESFPNYRNIFGTVEKSMESPGVWTSDFTSIKAGSFLKANDGFLILDAMEVLLEHGVWINLKRYLKNQECQVQNYDPFYLFSASAMKPEEIKTNVKVIFVGTDYLYQLLSYYDEDFKKIFKVKADFDSTMKNDIDNIYEYAKVAKRICQEEKILDLDASGVASLVEFGVREAGRKKKITTKFNTMRDLLVEANFWANQNNKEFIDGCSIENAINQKIFRLKMIEEKIQEMIDDGIILIDTEGAKVGQVNGLAVYQMGDYMFGKPCRITAKTSMGRAGIINIEREAEMSGHTHNKGMLILSGYLRSRYAQDKPLSLSASICFEQSYSGVDGDSASSTEAYALLSSLSELPIRQDLAVTGSLNQNGEVQAIGGVNEKIEGFFEVCKAKGFTGTQGVLIPKSNVGDLMLKKEVVEAVERNEFHLYAVSNLDEGIELLTGVEANIVNSKVNEKLTNLAKGLEKFSNSDDSKEESKNKKKECNCN